MPHRRLKIRTLGYALGSGLPRFRVSARPDQGRSPKFRNSLTARQSRASHPAAKPFRWRMYSSTNKIQFLAGSCQMTLHKNPNLLPVKWAKTSIVILLQHTHNLKVQIRTLRRAQTECTANRERTTFSIAIYPPPTPVVAPNEQFPNDGQNPARTMRCPREFGVSISTISRSASTAISTT